MKKKILTTWFTSLLLFLIVPYLPQSTGLPQLTVAAPSSVVENNTFSVSVTTGNSSPIVNVTVLFNNHTEITDFSGIASFTAPQVDSDTIYSIVATKTGYLDGMTTILVTDNPPPTSHITVFSPNGGESWQTGTVHDITWSTTSNITNVKIDLYTGTVFDRTIETSTANDYIYSWLIPSNQSLGSNYKIKITSTSNTSIYDFSDTFFAIVTPAPPPQSTINLTAPNGGESWQTGTTHYITWAATGNIANVKIELYKNGIYDSTITANTQSTRPYYNWTIPSAQTTGTTYKIKITDISNTSIYDYSDSSFSITSLQPPPQSTITITVPNGGESWQTGTTHDITWATTGTITSVKIELYLGTIFNSKITTSTANDGTYSWFIPSNQSSGSNYKIKITSTSDTGINDYSDSSFSITSSQPPPSEPQLIIHTSSSAVEGTTFWVTITANETLIQSATVTFNDNTYLTNSEGKTQLTAPLVEHDSTFSITATKQGYQSATAPITITNQGNIVETGWIYGNVVNTSNASIGDVNVCVILSYENNVITSKCTSTDNNGTYNISVSPGTYAIQAKKEGYATYTVNAVTVQKNTGHEVNFILQHETNGGKNQYLIDYAMNRIIEQGIISGTIDVQSPPQHEGFLTQVSTYNTPVSIHIETITPTTLVFNISAPEGTIGKIITVRFGPGTLDDMKNVTILYDNASIPWVDFDSIFASGNETNDTARWTSVLAIDGNGNEILYCLLWIPHFSTHTISITTSQIITALSELMAMTLYIVIIVVLAVVTAIPIVRLWRKIE
jgi:hypothetical protein